MKSYSQAAQDRFVHALLPISNGTFVDIGCSGKENSNTLGLEELGWTGILIDIRQEALDVPRRNPFFCCDAAKFDWSDFKRPFDYLSLDVDSHSFKALQNIPLAEVRFKVITAEHDLYAYPSVKDSFRDEMRAHFKAHGYTLICGDVHNDGLPYEDWWCCEELKDQAKRFESEGLGWKEIIARA